MPARIITSSVNVEVCTVPLNKFILEKLKLFAERTFLIEYETGKQFTYATLLNDSLRIASALKKLNLNPGDIFMVYGFNCYEFFVAILAGLYIGAIALPLRGADTSSEFHKELESKDVRLLFIDSKLRNTALSVKKASTLIKNVILLNGADNESEIKSIRSLLKENTTPLTDDEIYDPRGNQNSIAFVLESSGTTGPTKSAQLAYYDLSTLFNTDNAFTEQMVDEIILGASPIAHLSGLMSFLFTVTKGVKLVSVRDNTLENNIGAIEKYKISQTILSPSMITQLLKTDRPIDTSSLTKVFVGGSRLPKGLGDEFVKKFNIKEFRNAYTMTEITALSTVGDNKIGQFEAIGKIAPGMQIKVVDTETEKILGENQVGEIRVKGPFSFKGYYKNEKISKELTDSDGFIKTGDIGYFDESETFYVVDRIKDIIKQNGFGFSPVDIEEVLMKHELVQEAAVVGIPDAVAGELSHAFVVLKPNVNKDAVDKQQLIDFVNKDVSHLKQLKGEVHWVDDLPRTNFGKILRRKLRDDYLNIANNNYADSK